jgi:hypothetical protein
MHGHTPALRYLACQPSGSGHTHTHSPGGLSLGSAARRSLAALGDRQSYGSTACRHSDSPTPARTPPAGMISISSRNHENLEVLGAVSSILLAASLAAALTSSLDPGPADVAVDACRTTLTCLQRPDAATPPSTLYLNFPWNARGFDARMSAIAFAGFGQPSLLHDAPPGCLDTHSASPILACAVQGMWQPSTQPSRRTGTGGRPYVQSQPVPEAANLVRKTKTWRFHGPKERPQS